MTTYSLSITAVSPGAPYQVKNYTLPDADAAGNALSKNGTAEGGVMSRNNQVLCKGPDGALNWYTIDPVRSVPGGTLVLLPVGP